MNTELNVFFKIHIHTILYNTLIELYQVQPYWARMDLGAMAMKGCSSFPMAPASLEPNLIYIYIYIYMYIYIWNGNERVHHIPHGSDITRTSPSYCLL